MQNLLDVILPVFLVIGFGYVAVWRGLFPLAGIDGVMRFTQNFAIPCLLFQAIAKLDLASSFDPRLLISFYAGATICFSLGLFGARVLLKRDWEDCVAIGTCRLFSNSVLLADPAPHSAQVSHFLSRFRVHGLATSAGRGRHTNLVLRSFGTVARRDSRKH